ncbi:MAG: hypothetical protein GX892_09755 [Thermoanaerobacteraceae bacterium]|nr:hypothetical protein [Thermoanaerobacteraceae bacterium]
MLLCHREKQTLRLLSEYGQATRQQLKELCNASDKNIENLIKYRLAKEEDGIIMLRAVSKKEQKMVLSLELLKYFLLNYDDIQWHSRSYFPFFISLYRNDKVFDITAVSPGEETFMATALNRSQSSRILIVLEEPAAPLRIDKPVRYFIPSEQKFYIGQNGQFIIDEYVTANI